jgi:hypothetical protein
MTNAALTPFQQRFERALDSGDLDAADAVLLDLPASLRSSFDAWVATLSQTDAVDADAAPIATADERRAALEARGVDAISASIVARLATGAADPAALVATAMQDAGLAIEQVGTQLVAELQLEHVPGAAARVIRAVRNVVEGRDEQVRRFAPAAVDALAKVLDTGAEQLRRAFDSVAPAAGGARFAGALAREGHDGVVLPDELAAQDDDAVDELFYRSL